MFEKTPLADLWIYTPKVFRDNRGFFFESYNQQHFTDAGFNTQFVQDNRSFSVKGTLRGLHLQTGSAAQAKLVTVLSGKVLDVAVDLRPQSKTFKKWWSMELNSENPQSLFIPKGFAHGFIVLSETAEFFYKVDSAYNKAKEAGIQFNDPELNIDWKLPAEQLILSEKDKALPTLKKFLEDNI